MLKELINKIIWHPDYSAEDYEIIYLHRVGPRGDHKNKESNPTHAYKKVPISEVFIEYSFIVCNVNNQRTHIPLHRILEIRNKRTGEILYKKSYPYH
ncbi:MAG TPA: DUF504 domain-containing protein [Methanothermococcus okinawensis]|uniref:UPF0248 protein EYG76_00590 n=1 Tax=Methanothermococcus okinawensis TaxID=155863 RepID=A0A832YTJ7_9EURY|nr:DUF504 domain-containing protein [Methanothermococcus okinawensis]